MDTMQLSHHVRVRTSSDISELPEHYGENIGLAHIERLMESIANRRDVLATHTSAIATFNSFARMDVVLRHKQHIK